MEKLLEMAKKVADKVEVYSSSSDTSEINLSNNKIKEMIVSNQSGIAIRIIKDGKLGFAYTRNLIDREELIQNALNSLKGEVEANFDFPLTKNLPKLNNYNPEIENVTSKQMIENIKDSYDYLRASIEKNDLELFNATVKTDIRIINSKGTDLSDKLSAFYSYLISVFPGSASGFVRSKRYKSFLKDSKDFLDDIIFLTNSAKKNVNVKTQKLKALFMPNSMYTLNWRINSGLNAQNIYDKISPNIDKIGKKVFSDKITYIDNPLNDEFPNANSFDSEGVEKKPLTLIENGVIKSFYYDLKYANKLNAKSTGHGYKGNGDISSDISPSLQHIEYKCGKKSFEELIKSIDKGVIIEGALGAHSGNIPNGDYSIGVDPGLYVENGEIVGRVKDIMIAGNIYDTLNNVVEVGKDNFFAFNGHFPPILCDNVSLSSEN